MRSENGGDKDELAAPQACCSLPALQAGEREGRGFSVWVRIFSVNQSNHMTAWLTATDLIDELRCETAQLALWAVAGVERGRQTARQVPHECQVPLPLPVQRPPAHCDTHITNCDVWLWFHQINFLEPHKELIYWLEWIMCREELAELPFATH